MKRCHYCKKPLGENEYVTVFQYGKIVHYCPEHKGFKRPDQFFWSLILEIIDEPVLVPEIVNRLKPVLGSYDPGRVSRFLYEKKGYFQDLFTEKVDGHYKDLNHKINLLIRILKRDYPNYHFREEKEDIAVNSSRYEPDYDNSMKSTVIPKVHPRETIQQKKDRLLKQMEQTPASSSSKYKGLFGYILDEEN